MPCSDTDLLVGLIRGDKDAVDKIKSLEDKGTTMSTTTITACELFRVAFRSSRPNENLALVENILKNLKVLDFNLKSSKIAGELIEKLRTSGYQIRDMDVIIASIAIANDEALITRKLEHFKRIKDLRLEIW
ncbi:MAG: PIN domain-containing protein [Candidatus Altiarchaeota archaeon]|nr:PIN domain-containing protein [Candidatus Altiarchaeota archaeon]